MAQLANFIPGISPTYIVTQPQQKTNPQYWYSYIYTSNGVDYKLFSHHLSTDSQKDCNVVKQINSTYIDSTRDCWAYGVWSAGARSW